MKNNTLNVHRSKKDVSCISLKMCCLTLYLTMIGIFIWFFIGQKERIRLQQIVKDFPTTIPAMPFVGHTYLYFGSGEDRMKALQIFGRDAIKQGGTITMWQASKLYLYVSDPEIGDILLKSCLSKDENTLRFTRAVIGYGSIFAPVHIWRPRRKVLAPVFSPRNINAFVKIFAQQSTTMVALLRSKVGAGDFSIWRYVTTYTFDSVSESNLGVKMNSQKQEHHLFLEAFERASTFVAARMFQPWLYSDFVYRLLPSYWKLRKCAKYLNDFVDEIIKEKRRSLDNNIKSNSTNKSETTKTFLEMIIESSSREGSYNDVELREETMVILMAGTDTSAVGACFTLVLLSRYPDVQELVYNELQEVFGDSDRNVVVEDLFQLKYLEAVIKESLRLYPPVPVIVREVHNDVKLPTGTVLVKGVRVLLNIWAMHRNHRYWGEDADNFRPERFLQGPLKHPTQYIPFSYGMRNCLGYQYAMMSMKTVIASLLRKYRVLPPAGLNPAYFQEPLRIKYEVMMKHVDNFVVRLENRT